jgi:hypothetical protein
MDAYQACDKGIRERRLGGIQECVARLLAAVRVQGEDLVTGESVGCRCRARRVVKSHCGQFFSLPGGKKRRPWWARLDE